MSRLIRDEQLVTLFVDENQQPLVYDPVGAGVLGAAERARLYEEDPPALQRLEARAQERGGCGVVIIDADDPFWSPFRDFLMPDHDWDAYRAKGQRPRARGVVPNETIQHLMELTFQHKEMKGRAPVEMPPIAVVVFAQGGFSVLDATS